MEIKKVSTYERYFYSVLGIILFPSLLLFYSNFFERENYINRKRLYRYLLQNPDLLKMGDKLSPDSPGMIWEFDNFRLYLWRSGKWSLHEDGKVIINSFHSGILDNYYYHKIQNLLKTASKRDKNNE